MNTDCPSCGPYCRCEPGSPIVGEVAHPATANLTVTGYTPIKLLLHEDGTITWEPNYRAFAPKEGTE